MNLHSFQHPAAPSHTVAESVTHARVLRKLSPSSRGALKLSQRYGSALVCVRHRRSEDGCTRFTTVELLVDAALVASRGDELVGVRIAYQARDLQDAARAAGARWDPDRRVWRMPRDVAGRLKLLDRVLEK